MTQCNFPYIANNIQMDEMWDRLHENDDTNNQVDIVSDCESDFYEDFVPDLDNIENDDESNSVDMLSFVIDQLKQEGSSLDADLSELHGVKLKLPNVPQTAREADLSELQGVK
jgi:hypothetical protein